MPKSLKPKKKEIDRSIELYQALSEDYYSVYFVDFVNDTIKPYRLSDNIERDYGSFFRTNPTYDAAIIGYIENSVLEEERAEMLRVASYENLKNQLLDKDVFMHDFHAIKDGATFYCRMKVVNLGETGTLNEAVMGFANVDSVKQKELERLAYIDNITGGYNYTHFQEQLKKESRIGNFVSVDIRAFKIVNDVCGMQTGDLVLREVNGIISECVRSDDYYGHINADHFVIFLAERKAEEIEQILRNISKKVNSLSTEMDIPRIGVYFGVSEWIPGKRVTVAFNEANKAKHNIKSRKDIFYSFYRKEDSQKSHEEKMMMAAFDKALEEERFEVWYQPKYSPDNGYMTGAEALVRWRHFNGELISPAKFIPLFEKNGLIRVLDEYVFRHVCMQQKEWINTIGMTVPVSINLSRSSLYFENVVKQYRHIAEEEGIMPELVPIEITESITIDNQEIEELAQEFYEAGFALHIDDFGTGYSSLSMLNMIKFNTLKIDKSLIDYIGNYGGDQLLRHTISLAKELGLHITAEGVEKENQVEFLKSLDCDNIQGYYYSKPVPAESFIEKLRSEKLSDKYVYKKGQKITFSMIIDKLRAGIGTSTTKKHVGHAAIQINVTGEGEGALYIEIDNYKIDVQPYEYYDKDVLLTVSSDVLIEIISRRMKLSEAYERNLIEVEGDYDALLILQEVAIANEKKES